MPDETDKAAAATPESQGPAMGSPRRDPLVPFDYDRSFLSRPCWGMVRPFFRMFNWLYFSSIRYVGLENLPREGPVVLAVNHPAVIDSSLIGAYLTRRRLFYTMSEEELFLDRFPFKLMALLITPLGAYPVDRRLAIDRQAVKYTVDRLCEGNMVLLAPEGGTERGWGLLPFRSGFVLLPLLARERLLRQGKPAEIQIVPAAILYRETPRALRTKRAMRFRARASFSIGKPFSLEDFVTPGKKKQQIMEEVTAYTRTWVEELLRQLEEDLK